MLERGGQGALARTRRTGSSCSQVQPAITWVMCRRCASSQQQGRHTSIGARAALPQSRQGYSGSRFDSVCSQDRNVVSAGLHAARSAAPVPGGTRVSPEQATGRAKWDSAELTLHAVGTTVQPALGGVSTRPSLGLIPETGHPHLDPPSGGAGLCSGWVRSRSGSCWCRRTKRTYGT